MVHRHLVAPVEAIKLSYSSVPSLDHMDEATSAPLQDRHLTPVPLPGDPRSAERFGVRYVDERFETRPVSYYAIKRAMDISLAAVGLAVLAPVMACVAVAIKATDGGPIIFRQVRVGRGGRYFWCLKFRSMCVDAERKQANLVHLNEASGPVFKITRDPRITPVGVFIRKFSLDELPQLFNVLKGEMSLVGPRPPLPKEVCEYTAGHRIRLAVVPGLTCLWQVSGRSDVSFDRWVELDRQYIESMSVWTDLRILLMTLPAVIKGTGAR